MSSEGSFNLQQAPKWQRVLILYGRQKGAFTYNTQQQHQWPALWPRMQNETKGDKQQGILKPVTWNKIVNAMSQTVLFNSAFETSDVFVIDLPGRHCLSQCGRPVFKMETLPLWQPMPGCPLLCPLFPSSPTSLEYKAENCSNFQQALMVV